MRTMKKILAIVLCLAMTLGLLACGVTNTPSTTEPTTTPVTEPVQTTASPPDAQALYAAAKEKLDTATDLALTIQYEKTTTVGGESFLESSTQTLLLYGIGSEEFSAFLTEKLYYPTYLEGADYSFYISEIYCNGNAYFSGADAAFRSEMNQQDYISRFAPALLLDASLYDTADVNAQGTLLTFSGATAMESWLAADDAELVEASGTITLTADGAIKQNRYDVTYTYGPAEIQLSVKVSPNTPGEKTFTAPVDEDYTPIETFDAPRLLYQGWGYAEQATSMTYSSIDSLMSQAAGVLRNSSIVMNAYGSGEDIIAKVENAVYLIDYTRGGESSEYAQEELFRDGEYSITVDDEPMEISYTVNANLMRQYVYGLLVDLSADPSTAASLTVTDLGSLYLIEYTGTEDLGLSIHDWTCNLLFQDSTLLTGLASAYATDTIEGYVAIDKYTGLPTSTGLLYEGHHTIDGIDYTLSYQKDQAVNLASLYSYKAITDEVMPAEEPEQKASPLFYKVTAPDGQLMWLLGTIHVGDSRTAYLPQEIYDALLSSDALAVECDVEAFEEQTEEDEEVQEAVNDAYFYSDGTTAADHITDAELYDYAVKLMKATGNYNMNTPYLKPSLWSQALDNYFLQQGYCLTSDRGVDMQLIQMAKENGIELREIESALAQTQMTTGYSDELQEELLAGSASADAADSWKDVQELFEMWCEGDETKFIEYFTDDTSEMTEEEQELYDEYNTAMMTDRNDDMLNAAIEYLESGETVFYAVGLAHLLAPDGLVFTLREAGYTVELVTYE